jgi:hypothetical protein
MDLMRFLALASIFLLSLNSCLTAADLPCPLALHAPKPIQVDEDRIRQHIAFLAGDKLAGRSGAGSQLAAEYLKKEFQSLELQPLFDGDFFQPVPGSEKFGIAGGRNVGALLPGSDPKLREEYIIIAAHYDHLGTRGGAIFPGADDNASGTAMMLEAARVLSQSPKKLKRSVMFVGFDLEERLLWGSRWFVAHSPVPQEQMKCLLVADMIGRSLAGPRSQHGVCDGERAFSSINRSTRRNQDSRGITLGPFGNRPDWHPQRLWTILECGNSVSVFLVRRTSRLSQADGYSRKNSLPTSRDGDRFGSTIDGETC